MESVVNISRKIKVTCTDGDRKSFDLDEGVASQSGIITNAIVDGMGEIELPNTIRSNVMTIVVSYINKQAKAKSEGENQALRDNEFNNLVYKPEMTFQIMKATEFLDIVSLVDATGKAAAKLLERRTPLEIRKKFNIIGDNNPEDEAKAQAWTYNGRG